MSNNILFIVLNLIGISLFIGWIVSTIKQYSKSHNKESFFSWKRFKYPLMVILIISVPYLVVNYTHFTVWFHIDAASASQKLFIHTVLIAFLISAVWVYYIVQLDIYEPEQWKHVIFVFVASIGTTYLCDILYPLFHSFGFKLNNDPLNDFLYCVFGIGLIEETVKLIPLLLILKFTKAIDEPFDYIIYASVSALGFAFAENIRYFGNYGLEIIHARAFYAAVAHMTFSSTIAYGMLLHKHRYSRFPFPLVFLFFFGIAIFSHGFYDFWLINPVVSQYKAITILFFLITIHIWFVMKNNAINISNFFDASIQINNEMIKHYLILYLIGIFMISYVYIALTQNYVAANQHFFQSIYVHGYVVFYLIAGLSRFKVIQGYLKPLSIPFDFIVPRVKKSS